MLTPSCRLWTDLAVTLSWVKSVSQQLFVFIILAFIFLFSSFSCTSVRFVIYLINEYLIVLYCKSAKIIAE